MSGNENEMPDSTTSRLRDRVTSEFQRRRQQAQAAAEGASRLRDTAQSTFQERREQAAQFEERINERREQFGNALGIGGDLVEPVQFGDRDSDVGFVPTDEGRDELATDFASERDFIQPDDTIVDADPVEGTRTMTAPGARDEIAARAADATASEAQFIGEQDLDVEVGPGGVSRVETAPDRRDDIAERVRGEVAGDDPFVRDDDVAVDVGARGVTDVGLTPAGRRERAAREFTADTPLSDVDPAADIQQRGEGFGLTTPAQRRAAARGFESALDTFGPGELDPQTDIRPTGDDFGLTRQRGREAAADQIDRQLPEVDVGPSDIDFEEVGNGEFEATFSTEVSR